MRFLVKILLIFLLLPRILAQPTISNHTRSELEHSSVRITFTSSPAAYFWVKYGVATGTYIYSTQSSGGVSGAWSTMAITLGGLAPSTTYYYVIEARNTLATDCVSTPANCTTTSEQSFTTPAAGTHPVIPTLPTEYAPTPPSTTGYDVVRMIRGGSGDCVAESTVNGSDTVNNWTVTAGDSMQTVLGAIRYGTIIKIAQGITCDIPANNAGNQGYSPRWKDVDPRASSINDATHKWIIIETEELATSDFPPFGSRTGPLWTKMATLKGFDNHRGVIFWFDTDNGLAGKGVHHYWIRNIKGALTTGEAFQWPGLIRVGDYTNGESWYSPPKYNVLDRIYLVGNPAPKCTKYGVGIFAEYFAMYGLNLEGFDCVGDTPIPIYVYDRTPGPLTIENNYIEGPGQSFYMETLESGVAASDIVFRRNYVKWPLSKMNPASQGFSYDGLGSRVSRQQWECKGCRRVLIEGNLMDGNWSSQNEGMFINISPISNPNAGTTGNKDYTIRNNLMRRGASGISCGSTRPCRGGECGPPDVAVTSRVLIQNNLLFDMGRGIFQDVSGTAGLVNYGINNDCMDTTIVNNTFGRRDNRCVGGGSGVQHITAFMSVGYGTHASEGFTFKDNLHYVGSGSYAGVVWDRAYVHSAHPKVPEITAYGSGGTYRNALNLTYGTLTGAAGLTASYTWTGNVIVGDGKSVYCTDTWADMSQAEVDAFHTAGQDWPGANDLWMAGSTKALRETAAGLTNPSGNDYHVSATTSHGGHAGANVEQIYASMGIVSKIKVLSTATGASFGYQAPDNRACSIYTSPDGTTWSRTNDSGGGRIRNTAVSGLSASTTYQYRLMCYFDQTSANDLLTSDQYTTGSFTTTTSGTRDISVGFSLPSGASSIRISVTPIGGSQVQATCTTSPCALTLGQRGAYTQLIEYLDSGNNVIRTSPLTYLFTN